MSLPVFRLVGTQDPDRRRPLRREIDEWYTSTAQEDQDQVYLFVHALLFW